jgi:hypothetical protein
LPRSEFWLVIDIAVAWNGVASKLVPDFDCAEVVKHLVFTGLIQPELPSVWIMLWLVLTGTAVSML